MDESGVLELDDGITEGFKDQNEIPRLNASNTTYSEFFYGFLLNNKPGIVRGLTDSWACTKSWVKNESLNADYFWEKYRKAEVPISNCGKRWYNIQEKCTMIMNDYLSYWENYPRGNSQGMDCLYLKDWHFTKQFPDENIYRVPQYFASDWLNEYYDTNKLLDDDFRFVYIGPKGSWTPFHSDVLTSFSWSANICGRKRWILLPPGTEENFKDEFGDFKYDISENDEGGTEMYEVIQEKGEIIFVPSGWYHQVQNLEDAISINHNWINACNVFYVWESLKSSLLEVKKEIADCDGDEDWDEDCQRLLMASFGFDYYRFYVFLSQIAKVRMEKLRQGQSLMVYGGWCIGKKHMIFDLKRILSLLNVINTDKDFQKLDFTESQNPTRFLELLENFLHCEVHCF